VRNRTYFPASSPSIVENEGRRGIRLVFRFRLLAFAHHKGFEILVGETGLDLILAHAGEFAERRDRGLRVAGEGPFFLALEQEIDQREVTVRLGATRQHGGSQPGLVEGKIAGDVTDLAGIDIIRLQLGKGFPLELGAMRAGQREIFDDGHRRGGAAQGSFRHRIACLIGGRYGGGDGGRNRRAGLGRYLPGDPAEGDDGNGQSYETIAHES
jgi:hypothetical protein